MSRNVIVGVLNWGIGHATRMMPVIHYLLHSGAQVTLASDGAALQVLRQAFPALSVLTLPGYGVQYDRSFPAWWATLWQGDKIQRAIAKEHTALSVWLERHPADLIISDNRYGLWHSGVRSIFLTHQYRPAAPAGGHWLVHQWAKRQYRHFNAIYLVDDLVLNLAGKLSQRGFSENGVQVIGPLSALSLAQHVAPQRINTLVLLSGPEPQRTLLAEKVMAQWHHHPGAIRVVGGAPHQEHTGDKRYCPYVPPSALQRWVSGADSIICRAGYSSLMDIAYSGKPALVIPTPGQPEQEYLARLWHQRRWAVTVRQSAFSLHRGLEQLKAFSPEFPVHCQASYTQYTQVIDQWLSA